MGNSENTKAKGSSIHTSSASDNRPTVQKVHCDLNVPPATAAIIGKPQYYATDELDRQFGKKKNATYDDSSQVEYPPQNYEPVRWEKISLELRERLLNKWKELGEGENTDPDWSRLTNCLVRHIGCDHTPPDYYLNYGYYYCKGFNEVLRPQLSVKGQSWLIETSQLLQEGLEDALAQNMVRDQITIKSTRYPDSDLYMKVPKKKLEISNNLFKSCAFGIHPIAYLDAGLLDLMPYHVDDMLKIMNFIDASEWRDPATYNQIRKVMMEVPERLMQIPGQVIDDAKKAADQAGRQLAEEMRDAAVKKAFEKIKDFLKPKIK